MITENITRIAALDPPYDDEVAEELGRMMPPGVAPIGLFRTFAKNLPMTRAMQTWGRYELGRELTLPLRDREIVIDRVCARCGCEYEWGVHVAFFAERAGLGPEQVRSLTVGSAGDPCWHDPRDRVLIEVVDSLHDHADLADDLWAALDGFYDESQILDLLLLAGWYHAICYVAQGARVAPEPGTPTFADYCDEQRFGRQA